MEIGLAIAMRREQLGLTQEDIASYVGVSKASVCRWESGYIANMRRDKIQKLADILNVSPLELLKEDADLTSVNLSASKPEHISAQYLSGNAKIMVSIFSGLTDTQQGELIGRAKVMAEQNAAEQAACVADENVS